MKTFYFFASYAFGIEEICKMFDPLLKISINLVATSNRFMESTYQYVTEVIDAIFGAKVCACVQTILLQLLKHI